jgi:hypothetical protein
MNTEIETRVAILEKIAIAHDTRLGFIEDFHREVVDRLDQKMQLDVANQISLERTLSKAAANVESLTDIIRLVAVNADEASQLVRKHQSFGILLVKIGGLITIIVPLVIGAVFLFKG